MNKMISLGLVLILISCADVAPIPDSQIGLSKESVFEVPNPDPVEENLTDPGEGPLVPRAFTGSPPRISHSIADMVPITRDENLCLDCHMLEEKSAGEPTPIPESHYVDLRHAPDEVRDTPAGARYNCTMCHVSQTGAAPLVANRIGE